jgi:putative ATPase
MGFFDALAAVEQEKEAQVPSHLKDASRDKEGFGHGAGYLYPHSYRDHWVAQQYLPDALQGRVFYQPGQLGYEETVAVQVQQRREAQLAAALESDGQQAPPEILSSSPDDKGLDRWLARTISNTSERLAEVRENLFAAASPQRHHVVFVPNADNGLLVWEAVRQTPEGGVWAAVSSAGSAEVLRQQGHWCPALRSPQIVICRPDDLGEVHTRLDAPAVRFDRIVGRNCLAKLGPGKREALLQEFRSLLRPDGVVALAESIPSRAQRLHQLLEVSVLGQDLHTRLVAAEEAIFTRTDDPSLDWEADDLIEWAKAAGFRDCQCQVLRQSGPQFISPARIEQWFGESRRPGRASYGERLAEHLTTEELDAVRGAVESRLAGQSVEWHFHIGILRAARA